MLIFSERVLFTRKAQYVLQCCLLLSPECFYHLVFVLVLVHLRAFVFLPGSLPCSRLRPTALLPLPPLSVPRPCLSIPPLLVILPTLHLYNCVMINSFISLQVQCPHFHVVTSPSTVLKHTLPSSSDRKKPFVCHYIYLLPHKVIRKKKKGAYRKEKET